MARPDCASLRKCLHALARGRKVASIHSASQRVAWRSGARQRNLLDRTTGLPANTSSLDRHCDGHAKAKRYSSQQDPHPSQNIPSDTESQERLEFIWQWHRLKRGDIGAACVPFWDPSRYKTRQDGCHSQHLTDHLATVSSLETNTQHPIMALCMRDHVSLPQNMRALGMMKRIRKPPFPTGFSRASKFELESPGKFIPHV